MRAQSEKNAVNRILDANINRAKEGLRVCEEITRFVLQDRGLTSRLKKIRHEISRYAKFPAQKSELLKNRDASGDTGKNIYLQELKRRNIQDIFFANIQRVKESLRVLEEFSKLITSSRAKAFKKLRYAIYGLEKEITAKVSALYNPGQRNPRHKGTL